jgi:hypothetical protein
MTHRLKRLFTGTRTLESRLTASIERRAHDWTGAPVTQPLEIIEHAVDAIAGHVHPAGRGRHTFPFNRVRVTFVAPTAEGRARMDAMCASAPALGERVLRRLTSAGCQIAETDLDISIDFVEAPDPVWTAPYGLALARAEASEREPRADAGAAVQIDVLVTAGTAERGAYSFATLPIAIGRGADVRDSQRRLVRINHVSFLEPPARSLNEAESFSDRAADKDINATVSRRHARIELDALTGRPRVIDENSAQGTSIIRQGRGIAVPRGSRGLGLQSGDEIVLGEARLTVRIATNN